MRPSAGVSSETTFDRCSAADEDHDSRLSLPRSEHSAKRPNERERGGKGLYTAAAAAQSGVATSLITWLPSADRGLLRSLDPYPVAPFVIPIPTGTVNTNRHEGDVTVATTRLDPYVITPADLTDDKRDVLAHADIVHLAPDVAEKISLDAIRFLSHELGVKVTVDIGKYFRQLQPDGRLIARYPWPDEAAYLRFFDAVFLSTEDVAPALEAGGSLLSVARNLSGRGPAEVIVTRGSQGSFVFSREDNDAYDIPAFPPRVVVDPTGAGDTYVGAYLGERLRTDDPAKAGRYAAMAAGLKLQYVGPAREDGETVRRRLAEAGA